MPNFAKVIRDPIHGYVGLTPLELDIVDSPYFQRLRQIKQNGTAYLTYPSCATNRFEHSLGVLHLARRMITQVFESSESSLVDAFLAECSRKTGVPKEEIESFIIEAVSIAALVHDIGHLPFSHLGESAVSRPKYIKAILKDDYQLYEDYQTDYDLQYHEFNTLRIIETKFKRIIEPKFFNAIVAIFKSPSEESPSIFRTLKAIISSEIDADRGDYLMRDGVISGAGFGTYDLDRLINTLRLYQRKDKSFVIRPAFTGMSAVETFLTERYKLHKWLYFHHKVVFTDALLIKTIRWLIDDAISSNGKEETLFDASSFHYDNYVKGGFLCDDVYIVNVLRNLYNLHKENPKKRMPSFLKKFLNIILFRKGEGISLWKDSYEYSKLTNECFAGPFVDGLKTKHRNTSDFGSTQEIHNEIEGNFLNFASRHIISRAGDDGKERLEHALNLREEDHFLISPRKFKSLDYEMISRDGTELLRLKQCSNMVRALEESWSQDIQVFVHLVHLIDNQKDKKSDEYKKEVVTHFGTVFSDWYQNDSSLANVDILEMKN